MYVKRYQEKQATSSICLCNIVSYFQGPECRQYVYIYPKKVFCCQRRSTLVYVCYTAAVRVYRPRGTSWWRAWCPSTWRWSRIPHQEQSTTLCSAFHIWSLFFHSWACHPLCRDLTFFLLKSNMILNFASDNALKIIGISNTYLPRFAPCDKETDLLKLCRNSFLECPALYRYTGIAFNDIVTSFCIRYHFRLFYLRIFYCLSVKI